MQVHITPVDTDMLVIKTTKAIIHFFPKLHLTGKIVSGDYISAAVAFILFHSEGFFFLLWLSATWQIYYFISFTLNFTRGKKNDTKKKLIQVQLVSDAV